MMGAYLSDDVVGALSNFYTEAHRKVADEEKKVSSHTFKADMYVSKDKVDLYCDLPGVDKNKLKIESTKNTMTIQGERPSLSDNSEVEFAERPAGVFSRMFRFNSTCFPDKSTASYDNGVLHVVIPRAATIEKKTIQIQ